MQVHSLSACVLHRTRSALLYVHADQISEDYHTGLYFIRVLCVITSIYGFKGREAS